MKKSYLIGTHFPPKKKMNNSRLVKNLTIPKSDIIYLVHLN